MTKKYLCDTMNHTDLLDLFTSSHRRCFIKKGVLKKRLQHWGFPVKFAEFLRISILKNISEGMLLFVSPQNTIANSRGEFGPDETLTECKVSIFLKITVLFDQMQPYHVYIN